MKNIDAEKLEIIEVLKGARKVNFNEILEREQKFYFEMKAKFGAKEKMVKECEDRLRDLIAVFAKAASVAYPEDAEINPASIGLITNTLQNYNWTVLVSKN